MTNAFWEILDNVLSASSTAADEKKAMTADASAQTLSESADGFGGPLIGFDVDRELCGNFAQHSSWAVSDYGDHWESIGR